MASFPSETQKWHLLSLVHPEDAILVGSFGHPRRRIPRIMPANRMSLKINLLSTSRHIAGVRQDAAEPLCVIDRTNPTIVGFPAFACMVDLRRRMLPSNPTAAHVVRPGMMSDMQCCGRSSLAQ